MNADLMEYYEKRLSQNPISNYISIFCKVDYPSISYNVESFKMRLKMIVRV
jgi:hypothetical protein